MSPAADADATDPRPGAAQHLPRGRLRSFEDGDDEDLDLSRLLQPRRPASPSPRPEPPAATVDDVAQPAPAAAPPALVTAEEDAHADADDDQGQDGADSSGAAGLATSRAATLRVRPTSLHIPVDLIDLVARERERTGRSNGQIVIAALEHTHHRLAELLGAPAPTSGGGLFAQRRASRSTRDRQGPLIALHVRLLEPDYAVLDGLVEEYGAFSRGHLVSAALTAYLQPQDPS